MVPIEFTKSDYSTSFEMDEGTRDVTTRDVTTQDGDEEVPSNGYFGCRPLPTTLRVEPADTVRRYRSPNALLA